MAKNLNNLVVRGFSGSIGGQLVIKRSKSGRTIISNHPSFRADRQFTPAQQSQHLAFREACAYAKTARDQEVYVHKAAGSDLSPYNLAVADWLRPPEILQVDTGGWTGQPGKVIRIQALDDVQVKDVTLVITDLAGALLEQGPATAVDSLWWEYTTTATGTGSLKVTASAQDLPGHVTQFTKLITKP